MPGLAARAGVVTGEVAVTLGADGEGMVAGDAVNTAARVQAAAEPGQVLVDGATQRLAGARGRVRRCRGACAEGQGGAGTLVAGDLGAVRRGGRHAAGGWAGGAADRPGRGAAHGPGAVSRGGGAAGAAAGAGVRAGRGGQVAAGLGVPQVHRRAGGDGVVAPGPVPVLRGGGGVLGAGGDRPAAAGHRRGRPCRGRRGQAGRGAGPVSSRTRPSGRMSGCGWAGCSASTFDRGWRGAAGPGGAVRGVAVVLRAAGGGASGGAAGRGRPVRRCRAAGFPGSPGRLGPGPAGLRAGAGPARAGPGPAGVRRRAEPDHADAGPAGCGVDGCAGGRAGAGDAAGGAGEGHRPGPGHPAVRGGDGARR